MTELHDDFISILTVFL